MKILVVTDGFAPFASGGAERMAGLLAAEYQRQGHEVVVATTAIGGDFDGPQEVEGIRTHVLPVGRKTGTLVRFRKGLNWPENVEWLRRILAMERPDAVHVHNVHRYFSWSALSAMADVGVRPVVTFHDTQSVHYGRFRARQAADLKISLWQRLQAAGIGFVAGREVAIRRILAESRAVNVAVSHKLANLLEANGLREVKVIHNGIPTPEVATEEQMEAFWQKHGLAGRTVILFAGRWNADKGSSFLQSAFARLESDLPVTLLVAGQGATCSANLPITCTGWIDGPELMTAYAVANVVVVPSQYLDPFPTVVLEAMAAGKPVITTESCGASEAVQPNATGYIAAGAEDFVRSLAECLRNPEGATAMGEAGRQRYLEKFTVERCARAYLDLFQSTGETAQPWPRA